MNPNTSTHCKRIDPEMNTTSTMPPPAATFVVKRLKPDLDDPGRGPRIACERLLASRGTEPTFVHPLATIEGLTESDEALALADKFHDDWYRRLHRRRKGSWRKTRLQQIGRFSLAYAYDGVVIERGEVIPFSLWKECRKLGVDVGEVYEFRPEAEEHLRSGDIHSLEELQSREVERLAKSDFHSDGRVHVVLPDLTMSLTRELNLGDRIRQERKGWKIKLKLATTGDPTRAIPESVWHGQVVFGGSVERLCKSVLTRAFST